MKRKIKKAANLLIKGNFKEFYQKTKAFIESTTVSHQNKKPPTKFELNVLSLPKQEDFPHLQILDFPKVENPEVTIVIPVFNKFEYTYNCLASILRNVSSKNYEILIADDNSSDETKNISFYAKNIKILRTPSNKGFLLNVNNAVNSINTEYVLLLNNDTQVAPNWLESLLTLIKEKNDAGIVGSKILYPDGRLQEAGGIIYSDGLGSNYGKFNPVFDAPEFSYVKECDYISGCSILFKKSLWDTIGGFDTVFTPAYYEDTDFCFKARKVGYKTYFQPESILVHSEGISNGTDLNSGIKKYQNINLVKFKDKWHKELQCQEQHSSDNDNIARDRSSNKIKILFIDDSVPKFDTNAGHRASFQYLKLLIEAGFAVTFMSQDGCRPQPYTSELQQLGIEVLYSDEPIAYFKRWWDQNHRFYDYAYVTRFGVAEAFLPIIHSKGTAKIIFNVCDLNYLRLAREKTLLLGSGETKELSDLKLREINICKQVDFVWTLSTVEKKILEEAGVKNVMVMPFLYFEEECESPEDIGLLFVGGFNHSPNQDGIMWFCKEILPLINSKARTKPKVLIVGSNPSENIRNLGNEQCIVTGYVSDYLLKTIYKAKLISIVPLRYGAGIKGKVAEAMHYGLPVVSTSIGLEGMPNLPSTIKSFDTPIDFSNEVVRLLNNEEAFSSSSSVNREYAKSQYAKGNIINFFKSVLKKDI